MAGLDLIYAGSPVPNPAELLAGPRMKELIESAAREYDRIIIDSPPVLLVSDAKMLARLADATLLLFNAATTRRGRPSGRSSNSKRWGPTSWAVSCSAPRP